jgi:hypothetical protein
VLEQIVVASADDDDDASVADEVEPNATRKLVSADQTAIERDMFLEMRSNII